MLHSEGEEKEEEHGEGEGERENKGHVMHLSQYPLTRYLCPLLQWEY